MGGRTSEIDSAPLPRWAEARKFIRQHTWWQINKYCTCSLFPYLLNDVLSTGM
jgi:hypothetical protein